MEVYRIYALSGPDMEPRYVGRTRCPLEVRAASHVYSAKTRKTALHCWIDDLQGGLVMRELEQAEIKTVLDPATGRHCSIAGKCETKWIMRFLDEGHDLFNVAQRSEPIRQFTVIPLERALDAIEAERAA